MKGARAVRRIAVLRSGALGDSVLSFPVLWALGKHRPGSTVVFCARSEARFCAVRCGLAREERDLGSPFFAPLFAAELTGGEAEEALGEFLRSFDLVVSLLSDPAGSISQRLSELGARRVLSFRGLRGRLSVARELFSVLLPLGITDFPQREVLLHPVQPPQAPPPEPFCVCHAGSGSPEKNWPANRFAAVAQKALERGFHVVLPQGEADAAAVGEVQRLLEGAGCVITVSCVELLWVLAGSTFYVGNDSGVSHLAGACGAHTVCVFGPSDPALWKPVGPSVYVVRGRFGTFPSPEEVIRLGRLGSFLEDR